MSGVNMPRRAPSSAGSSMGLIGAGVGAAFGGAAGAGIGMQAGSMLGASGKAPAGPDAVDAITRRKQALDNTPLRQIRDSIDSLQYVQDDQQRMELAKPLVMAEMAAKKNPYGG